MTPFVILRSARQDLATASRWYEERRAGRGRKFLDRVDEAIESIRRSPNAHRKIEDSNARIHLVRGFPYVILYRSEQGRIVIFAVIHGRRDPESWPKQ
ncbi:MAG: type II toxin-antitoxin system RelE/ParE family toxin [Planctomycetaceae bacterium]|nr:type II toxin-antitoxin system RelE/ParE family toxin [Planctomycetaceae bacterium]